MQKGIKFRVYPNKEQLIYACGDYVKLKSLRQCNGLRNKNPIALAVGVSNSKKGKIK